MTIQEIIDSIIENLRTKAKDAKTVEEKKSIELALNTFSAFFPNEESVLKGFKVKPNSTLYAFASYMSGVDHYLYTYSYLFDKIDEYAVAVNNMHNNFRLVAEHFNKNIAKLSSKLSGSYSFTYSDLYTFYYDFDINEWCCSIRYGNLRAMNKLKAGSTTLQIRNKDTKASCYFDVKEGKGGLTDDIEFLVSKKLI